MFKLLKDGECYSPEYIGKKDILLAYDRICKIEDCISENGLWDVSVFDCKDMFVCPGFIDQHVHITGGGGEEGPASRIPELMLGDIITAGVTTVVGLLGADAITRNMAALLAKAFALEAEGLTTYIYTGSYNIPTTTLTGKVITDISLIQKIIGVGEVAIADYRSPYPSGKLLKELAYEAVMGGMIGGKAGVMHIHVGDGKEGLSPLLKVEENTDFPIEMFVPTHLNRNKVLFTQAVEYALKGGNIDLTAGEASDKGYSIPDALELLMGKGVNIDRITFSSDGNGSMPSSTGNYSEVGRAGQLFEDFRNCILQKKIGLNTALKPVTSNVARVLKLYPKKGALCKNGDGDILVLNKKDLTINKLFIRGEVFIDHGNVLKKGRFE